MYTLSECHLHQDLAAVHRYPLQLMLVVIIYSSQFDLNLIAFRRIQYRKSVNMPVPSAVLRVTYASWIIYLCLMQRAVAEVKKGTFKKT